MDVDKDRALPRRPGRVASSGCAVTTRGPTHIDIDRDRGIPRRSNSVGSPRGAVTTARVLDGGQGGSTTAASGDGDGGEMHWPATAAGAPKST